MPRGLNAVLKTIQNASKSRNDKKFTATVGEIVTLVKQVKPGDALDAKVAQRLVTMFEERMVLLYSLMPREAIELAVAYFLVLASHLKSTEPSVIWQHVASKGILTGLKNYLEDGDATHFERPFFTCLCQILTVTSRAKLTIDMRQSIGGFLSDILPKHPQAKKWLLDSRVLGVAALGKLIMTETDFRVLDTIFAIAARLTPKRDDPQTRRAFLSDVFNSASSKARLGETICKNIIRIMDEPRKGPWFHLSDQLFTELAGNNKRPQRFVLQNLEVCGENLAAELAALRLFLDSEIVLDAFSEDEGGVEEMITTSFDNLRKVLIEELETDITSIVFELHSIPTWHNPRDSLIERHSYIKFQISNVESKRLREVLSSKGQGGKLSEPSAVHKQSFSHRDMKLEQATPAAARLKGKTDAIESYLRSDVLSPKSPTSTTHSVKSETNKTGHSIGKQHTSPSPPTKIFDRLFEEKSLSSPIKASSTATASKVRFGASTDTKHASVKRGVILDSDEDEQIPTPKPKQGSKRQASALSDIEDILSSNIKRPRRATPDDPILDLTKNPLETAKKEQAPGMEEGISLDSSPLDLSTHVKSSQNDGLGQKQKTIIIPQTLSKSEPSAPLYIKGRIKGMKAMDGKPAESSRRGPSGGVIPKAVRRAQEATTKDVRQTTELTKQFLVVSTSKSIPKSASKIPSLLISSPSQQKSKNNAMKPSKAIWEADDFSQQARMISAQPGNVEFALTLQSTPLVPPSNAPSSSTANGVNKTMIFGEDDNWAFAIEGFEPLPEVGVIVGHTVDLKHGIKTEDEGPYDEPSSPICPEMVVRRKLRDATIIAHPHPNKPESEIKGTNDHYRGKLGDNQSATTLAPEPQVKSVVKLQDNTRTLANAKADWKVAVKPPVLKAGPLTSTHQASVDQRKSRDDRAIRAAQKLKDMPMEITQKRPHVTKRKSSSSAESDGVESDIEESKVPKTEIDAIAEVMTKIQDRLVANIKVKVSGTKGEVRVARTNILEAAVADLDLMQGNLEASFARFMQLEETYGQVTQGVVGRLEELQGANESVAIMFRNIVQEHDRITTATRLPRSPFADPVPGCLTL